ncbi:HAT1-interacting factor 1, partial [Tremellales sp. Uapishka_1]
MAPLLLSYGRALYELAFSSQGVMGKEETDAVVQKAVADDAATSSSNANFVFSADPVSDEEEVEEEPTNGDTSIAQTNAADGEGEGDDAEELEDDYNAAWEVLDVARTIYLKLVEEKGEREDKLCLAECYAALGDVSTETENFSQAVQDYTSSLEIKSALLPASSRALAALHYQLATVLDFIPNGRVDALKHVEKAVEGFKARKQELEAGAQVDEEGKKYGENELKDVEGLLADLQVKLEELKTAPPPNDLVAESLDHLLGNSSSSAPLSTEPAGPINDLTSMVRKKAPKVVAAVKELAEGAQKKVETAVNGVEEISNGVKRKTEGEGVDEPADKKAKA